MIYTNKKPVDWDYIVSISPNFPYIKPELRYKYLQTWILYEKVIQESYDEKEQDYTYSITTPVLGLLFNFEPADQTVIEHFIIPFRAYHKNNYIDGAYGKTAEELKKLKYKSVTLNTSSEPLRDSIDNWSDFKYTLGMWNYKPTWKEMLKVIKEKSIYYKL